MQPRSVAKRIDGKATSRGIPVLQEPEHYVDDSPFSKGSISPSPQRRLTRARGPFGEPFPPTSGLCSSGNHVDWALIVTELCGVLWELCMVVPSKTRQTGPCDES